MNEDLKCKDCRFYGEVVSNAGHCRRYPPTILRSGDSLFPGVGMGKACGEFKPKEESDASDTA